MECSYGSRSRMEAVNKKKDMPIHPKILQTYHV